MTDPLEAAKLKAEKAYNAAADYFDAEPLGFWARYGRRTVERLRLRRGARVLDVCCGSGVPEFRRGDMTSLGYPDDHFDAVICVFGIFFVPDMETQVAELWRMVRPGGQLAITTWGARFWSPAYPIWLEAVRRVRPDLYSAFNPWDRITTPEAVLKLLQDGGAQNVEVTAEDGYQELRTPEDFWTMAKGSGLRWTIDQMGPELARDVKKEVLDGVAAQGIERVETNVIYAIAEKKSARS